MFFPVLGRKLWVPGREVVSGQAWSLSQAIRACSVMSQEQVSEDSVRS